jgi:hypothetical protein
MLTAEEKGALYVHAGQLPVCPCDGRHIPAPILGACRSIFSLEKPTNPTHFHRLHLPINVSHSRKYRMFLITIACRFASGLYQTEKDTFAIPRILSLSLCVHSSHLRPFRQATLLTVGVPVKLFRRRPGASTSARARLFTVCAQKLDRTARLRLSAESIPGGQRHGFRRRPVLLVGLATARAEVLKANRNPALTWLRLPGAGLLTGPFLAAIRVGRQWRRCRCTRSRRRADLPLLESFLTPAAPRLQVPTPTQSESQRFESQRFESQRENGWAKPGFRLAPRVSGESGCVGYPG